MIRLCLHRLLGSILLCTLSGCLAHYHEVVLYDAQGIRVGIETDPSSTGSAVSGQNSHPAEFTEDQIKALLGSLRVSGYSGTLAGLFVTPEPIPLFSRSELQLLAPPIAQAFDQAGPRDRIFFSLANPQARYERDRTAGTLFLRNGYLHVVLTDHYAFFRADTGGGEEKDPRDTKGMKLWVAPPAKAASLPKEEQPDWGPFEQVHISLQVTEILAGSGAPPQKEASKAEQSSPTGTAPQPAAQDESGRTLQRTDSDEDFRLQLHELTSSNLELRGRLKEQADELERLKQELERLREALKAGNSKASSGRNSSRKRSPP